MLNPKLEQLLAYLDREDISEVVLGPGRPVGVKTREGYKTVTSAVLTREQLDLLLVGSPLDHLIDVASQPIDVVVGGRGVRVDVIRRGDSPVLRIMTAGTSAPPPQTQQIATLGRRPLTMPPPSAAPTPAPAFDSSRVSLVPPASSLVPPAPVAAGSGGPPALSEPLPPDLVTRFTSPVRTPEKAATSFAASKLSVAMPMPVVDEPYNIAGPNPMDPDTLTLAEDTIPGARHQVLGARAPAAGAQAAVARPAPSAEPSGGAVGAVGTMIVDERSDISELAPLIRQARTRLASDLHLAAGTPTLVRVLGELVPLDPAAPAMTAEAVEAILMPLLGPVRRRQLAERGYVDLAIDVRGAGRLRGNISHQQRGLRGAFRLAASAPPTLESLGLPKELAKVVAHHQGLVIIAGPSGHGKTTTMAALVDLINASKPFHIITIEDPVEIEHPRKQAVISQREVGRHTKSFVAALKGSLREDPDVIVIGELRDRETVEIALTAAETGHLVLATMSTPSAAKTIDRLIDMFPPDDQSQVRASIAGALRAIIAQRLVPGARGEAMVAAVELVTGVLPLAVLIRDDKLYQLPNLMQRGRAFGMIRMDESLLELVRTGRITEETCRQMAENKKELAAALGGAPATTPTPTSRIPR